MLKYIVKRILQAVPLLILVTMICFTLINLAPYDAVDALRTDSMTEEELEAKRVSSRKIKFLSPAQKQRIIISVP